MMVSARGAARWWSNGQPVSFPTESYGTLANGDILGGMTFGLLSWPGQNPAVVFVLLAILFHVIMTYTLYGKRSYAIGSNEAAARMSGINVDRHKVLVYAIAGLLAAVAAIAADVEEPDRAGGHGGDVRTRRHRHGRDRRRLAGRAVGGRSLARCWARRSFR